MQAILLAILVVTDAMTIEILFALVLMLGVASGVAQPSRLALIPTLVDRESLASALAINSVIFNLARFIGPALAGIVIAEIGIAAAFAANAVSYIAEGPLHLPGRRAPDERACPIGPPRRH